MYKLGRGKHLAYLLNKKEISQKLIHYNIYIIIMYYYCVTQWQLVFFKITEIDQKIKLLVLTLSYSKKIGTYM